MDRRMSRGKGYEGNKEVWVYGYYVNTYNTPTIVIPDTAKEVVVASASVGQFTGLYDNTPWNELSVREQRKWLSLNDNDEWLGRPVFEGDIVKTNQGNICQVVWSSSGWCLTGNETFQNIKVIGNVYDTKDVSEQ